LVCGFLLMATAASAECVRTPAGRVVCGAGGSAVPGAAVVAPRPVSGATVVEGGAGGGAAYNPRTGNAAVSQTNARGVTTTQTSRGGDAKTKNGMGVAQGPGGKTCAKGRGEAKCN
jgi:hypothetical protein